MKYLLAVALALLCLTHSARAGRRLYTSELIEGATLVGDWRADDVTGSGNDVQLKRPSSVLKGDFESLAGASTYSSRLTKAVQRIRKEGPSILFIEVDGERADLVGDSGRLPYNSLTFKAVKSVISQLELKGKWSTLSIDEQVERSDLIVSGRIGDEGPSPKEYTIKVDKTYRGIPPVRLSVLPVSQEQLGVDSLFFIQRHSGTGPDYIVMNAIPMKDVQEYMDRLNEPRNSQSISPPWSEPLDGLRVRVTAPEGVEYHQGQPLSLTVELQNVSAKPIPFKSLLPHGRIRVTDTTGNWLGTPRLETALSPWEGRDDHLAPRTTLRWPLRVDRLRLRKPVTPGSTVYFQYSVPAQVDVPGQAPRINYSPPLAIKLHDVPPAPLGPDDLPERWTEQLELTYRESAGLGGPKRCVEVSGRGRITLVDCSGPGRIEATLPKRQLDALAARLRAIRVWELSKLNPQPAPPDAGEIRFVLGCGASSISGDYSTSLTRTEPILAALQAEMQTLIAATVQTVRAEQSGAGRSQSAFGLRGRLVVARPRITFDEHGSAHRTQPRLNPTSNSRTPLANCCDVASRKEYK